MARYKSLLCMALGLSVSLFFLIAPSPPSAYAQSSGYEQSTPVQKPSRGAPRETNLPEWAEPRTRSNRNQPNRADRSASESRSGAGAQPQMSPGTPINPDKVPLGGLEWLFAAGAGYGLWKLREGEG